jgi:hypothetical protein
VTVPVMIGSTLSDRGNAAGHVPPARGPDVPSVTATVPATLTESVIVPAYVLCGAVGVGSVGIETAGVEPLLHAASSAAVPIRRTPRRMAASEEPEYI